MAVGYFVKIHKELHPAPDRWWECDLNLGSNWISNPVPPHWHFLNYFTQKERTWINLFSSKICKLINEPENLWQILDICLQVLLQLKIIEDIINRLLKRNINYSTTAATMEQIKPPFGNSRKFLNVSSKMCWIRSHFVEGRDTPNQDITDRKPNYARAYKWFHDAFVQFKIYYVVINRLTSLKTALTNPLT